MIEINLSVHQLVDFVLRSGSLDTRYFNSDTMQEGTRLHGIYQAKQNDKYQKEVPLKGTIEYDNYRINLNGRADGIIVDDDQVTIDEIKTTNMPLEKFYEENKEWHIGQAVCYGYLYCLEHDLNDCIIQLTYISQINEKMMRKHFSYTFKELENKLVEYLIEYFDFQKILTKKQVQKIQSFSNLEFPFSTFRKGQKELIDRIQETIKTKDILFVEAPTGIGKTMSTIYSTLNPLVKNDLDKIFYLCPKNSGFTNSLNALEILNESGYRFVSVELQSKEKMCPFKLDRSCNPEQCPLADEFYYREKDALKEIFLNEDLITSQKVKNYALKHNICPFEFNLDCLLYADYIICDLNYVFHPISALKRFFENPDKQYKMSALIDESHNFLSRARDMYSCEIDYEQFKNLKKASKDFDSKELKSIINSINRDFKLFKKMEPIDEDIEIEVEQFEPNFIEKLAKLKKEMMEYKKIHPYLDEIPFRQFMINANTFLKIFEKLNETFSLLVSRKEENIIFSIKSIDPSKFIKEKLMQFENAVFFSATLKPFDFYEYSIMGSGSYPSMELESPFNPNNLKLMVNDSISVKYKDRAITIPNVVSQIKSVIDSKIGNYIVFVPSFEYLNLLKEHFSDDERFIFQEKSMKRSEIDNFLDSFVIDPSTTHVGICVLGGSFSEGIDLIGTRLIGTIVIGVGLPQMNKDNDRIKDYYTKIGLNGFEFAYTNPGINKVMQAIGRVIRTEEDKGVVLLIDSRMRWPKYKNTILHNKNYVIVKTNYDIERELHSFYLN